MTPAPSPAVGAASLLAWPELLEHLAACARTPEGARAALDLPLAADAAEARARYAAVAEVRAIEEGGERVPVGGVGDIRELVERAGRGTRLDGPELRLVGSTLDALRFLHRWASEHAEEAPRLWSAALPITVDAPLADLLRRSFASSGELSGEEYPVLDQLRRAVASHRSRIQSTLDDLLRSESFGALLQDRYVTERNGRYVVPVKASYRRGLGIVHGTSQSGETVYVEPAAVVEAHNDLKEVEAALAHEEAKILGELSRAVAARRRDIAASLDAALVVDLVCARAGLGQKLRGVTPEVGEEGVLVAREARHPLLQLGGVEVIPNDLALTPDTPGLVLTGPNAGGKTVALKTLGLLALLVRASVPLPAAAPTRVDFFEPVLADIGDQQSVADGLSTFSAHVLGLGRSVAAARPGSLVLIDEITSGTDPAQGAALARAVMEALVERGARVAVTTHFPELKTLPASDARFVVSAAEFADGRPTFRIQTGVPGPSHALAIARRMGVPEAVLERARAVMDTHARELAERLERLDEERAAVKRRDVELGLREDALRRRDQKLKEAEERLRVQRERSMEEATQKHRERLRGLEDEVKALVAALQANPGMKEANALLQTIRAARVPAAEAPAVEATVAPLEPGERVQVLALGQVAKVRTVAPDGRVEVEIGKLRSWLAPGAVERLSATETRTARKAERAAARLDTSETSHARPAERKQDVSRLTDRERALVRIDANTVDLRGKRVDEATAASELFFDRQAVGGFRTVFVLHGHGTGALKTAIRAWLPSCPYVRAWRPADADEGGDAYTVVELG